VHLPPQHLPSPPSPATHLAQAAALLTDLAGCDPRSAASALRVRAVREQQDVEVVAVSLVEAMTGDSAEDERLVVSLVETALSMDSRVDPGA
jgi:hypothetical protein